MIEGLFQPMHLIIILVIVLIVFGAGKLADVGGALGKSVKEFKESTSDLKEGQPKEPIQSASTNTAPPAPSYQQTAPPIKVNAGRADDL
jgi:sec-independent protein translocase protein TatA